MSRRRDQTAGSLIPDEARAAVLAEILKSVAHPLRLRIIALLCERDATVSELTDELDARQAIVSQQLRILRLHRLVAVGHRDGRPVYRLAEQQLRHLVACMNRCDAGAVVAAPRRSSR